MGRRSLRRVAYSPPTKSSPALFLTPIFLLAKISDKPSLTPITLFVTAVRRIHAAAPLMMSKSDHPNTKVDVDYDHKPSDNFTPLDPPIVSATTGNPFLRAGSGATIECTENLNDFLLRVDMPGVGRDGMKVWVNNGDVQVSGAEPPGEPTKRVYRGAMDLPALPHRADEMRVDIKNGVLKIAIPKG